MTASDPRLYGHDTFVAEVVDHLDVLYRVALRLTRRPQDAEDLVQETAARALTRRAQYQPGTNLRAWLLTIERSLFVSAYRHARRGPVTQSLEEVEEGSLYGRGAMAPSPSAENALLQDWMDHDLVAAVKADTFSLIAYEIGMFAWMIHRAHAWPAMQPTDWSYWLMMQIAMVCGFATTYPVNWLLIRLGVKEKM